MPRYTVRMNLRHDGRRYLSGSHVELPEDVGEPLQLKGVLGDPEPEPEPETPERQAEPPEQQPEAPERPGDPPTAKPKGRR